MIAKKIGTTLCIVLILLTNLSFAESSLSVRSNGKKLRTFQSENKAVKTVVFETVNEFPQIARNEIANYESQVRFISKDNKLNTKVFNKFIERSELFVSEVDAVKFEVKDIVSGIEVKFFYSITEKQFTKTKTFTKSWVKKNIKGSMSDYEKVLKINEFLIKNYSYWDDNKNDFSVEYQQRFSPYSLIAYNKGVCSAYSGMFSELAKLSGIEVIDITGKVKGTNELHSWNMVKINKNWYHVDTTFNEGFSTKDKISTNFLLIDDRTYSNYVDWDHRIYPVATRKYS